MTGRLGNMISVCRRRRQSTGGFAVVWIRQQR